MDYIGSAGNIYSDTTLRNINVHTHFHHCTVSVQWVLAFFTHFLYCDFFDFWVNNTAFHLTNGSLAGGVWHFVVKVFGSVSDIQVVPHISGPQECCAQSKKKTITSPKS